MIVQFLVCAGLGLATLSLKNFPQSFCNFTVETRQFEKITKENRVFKNVTNHEGIIEKSNITSSCQDQPVKVVVIDHEFDPRVKGMSSQLTDTFLRDFAERSQQDEETISGSAHKSNHANSVVDIIAGESGISPMTQIHPFDAKTLANKKGKTWDDALVSACDQAIEVGANFVNISLRMNSKDKLNDVISPRIRNAFLKLAKNGIVVFKSAGNDGEFIGKTPYTKSLAQLAEDMQGHLRFVVNTNYKESERLNEESNRAGVASQYTLAAPGTRILTHGATGILASTGTSFAAPIATGIAAKVKAQYPHFSNHEVAEIVAESARQSRYGVWFFESDYRLEERLYGQGVVNLKAALELAEMRSDNSVRGQVRLALIKGIEVGKTAAYKVSKMAKTFRSYVQITGASVLQFVRDAKQISLQRMAKDLQIHGCKDLA